MADPQQVGQAFLQYYYQLFESNRQGLSSLYQDGSMLTFEGTKFQGAQNIMTKMGQLPFNQCKVTAGSTDIQPSVSGGIMVFVTGSVLPEGNEHPLKFSHVFHLMPVNNSFVVTNEMFRLNY